MFEQDELNQLEIFLNTLKGEERWGIQHIQVLGTTEREIIVKTSRFDVVDILNGEFEEVEEERTELQTISLDAKSSISANQNAINKVKKLEKEGVICSEANIYFTPNIFKVPQKGKKYSKNKASVAKLTTLYVDIDNVTAEEYEERMSNTALPHPTFVINSGNGVHVYYVFATKLNAKKYEEKWIECQKYLTTKLNGDTAVQSDTSRLLRLPYTFNNKDKENVKKVDFIEFNSNNLIDLDEFHRTFAQQSKLAHEGMEMLTTDNSTTTKKAKSTKKKVVNNYAKYLKQDIDKLLKMRKNSGFTWEGLRNSTLLVLKAIKSSDDYIRYVNSTIFDVALSDNEVENVLNTDFNSYMKRETIYNYLQISEEEENHLKVLINETEASLKKHVKELETAETKLLNEYSRYLKINYINTAKSKNKTVKQIARELNISERSVKNMGKEAFTTEEKNQLCGMMLDSIERRIDMLNVIIKDTKKIDKTLKERIIAVEKRIKKMEETIMENNELTAKNKFKITILKKKYEEMSNLKKVA